MPQQPVDDWEDVADDWTDDWEDVPFEEEEEEEPVVTRPVAPQQPTVTPTAAPAVSPSAVAAPREQPSWFGGVSDYIPQPVKQAWDYASTPLVPQIGEYGRSAAALMNMPSSSEAVESGYYPMIRGFISGSMEGAGDVLSSLTSPLNLVTGGAFGGAARAAKMGAPAVARGLSAVGKGLSAPVAAQGAYHTATAETPTEALMGVTEVAGGLAGMKTPTPKARAPRAAAPLPVRPPIDPGFPVVESNYSPAQYAMDIAYMEARGQTVPPELRALAQEAPLPVRPPAIAEPNPLELPLQPEQPPATPEPQAATPEPEQGAFDPSTLFPEKPAGLEFIDPQTGETVPASQARPGMVPLTTEGTVATPETPPVTNLKDWIDRLVSEESGEFKPAELAAGIRRLVQGEEYLTEPPEQGRRVNPDELSRADREWLSNLPDDALNDLVVRFRANPNYDTPTGQNVINHALDILDERAANVGETFEAPEPTERAIQRAGAVEQSNMVRYGRRGERQIRWDPDTESYFDRNTGWEDVSDATPAEMETAQAINRGEIPDPYITEQVQRRLETPRLNLGSSITGIGEQIRGMTAAQANDFIWSISDDLRPRDVELLRQELDRFPTEGTREAVSLLNNIPVGLGRRGSIFEPETKGKTIEELEASKKRPALERLGKMIGEERAQKLASGEVEIKFEEKPRRTRSKKLQQHDIESWARWGDDQLRDFEADPSKPGLSVEKHEMSSLFPKAFDIVYRDAKGKVIGVLKTNLTAEGISTLAVDSKLGLRRGKVAFEMLKESFDRGVSEPSGTTSDLTNNLIDRVKRLVSSEKGELDLETLFKNLNDIMKGIGESKAGKLVERFIREEGGELNLPRLQELFEKQKKNTLSVEELAEAKQLAREAKSAATPTTPEASIPGVRRTPIQRRGPTRPPTEPELPPPAAPREPVFGPRESGEQIAQGLSQRLGAAIKPPVIPEPTQGTLPLPPVKPPKPPKPPKGKMHGPAPFVPRKPEAGPESSMLSQIWNIPRAMQSVDLPGITSAALRQSRPLAFTKDWFKAWNSAFKSFGSQGALDAINAKIREGEYFKPRIKEVKNRAGQTIRYKEMPSIAEELGLNVTDLLTKREEAISSSLAEKIPGYGRYIKASNRAYQGFLHHLRAAKFEQIMDGAKAQGRDPTKDVVLGKKLADFTNNATGRGSLKYFDGKVNLEPIAGIMGAGLYSPRALSARLAFMNPKNYTKADPLVRRQYWAGLARIGVSWGAFSGLASLMPGVSVSMDPDNADFGKIRIGNTRYDPGAGFQQLLVLSHRHLPQVLGGGETVSSTGPPGKQGKSTPLGSSKVADTRLSLQGKYIYNQLNPSLRFIWDMFAATQDEPLDLTDRSLQMVLPMYAVDIAEAAKEDPVVAEFFSPLLGSMGMGAQTYEKGSFGKPSVTPAIKRLTGYKVPTIEIGK